MSTITPAKRREIMRRLATIAKTEEARGDMPIARQAARQWRDLATAAEARRAPRYLRRWF